MILNREKHLICILHFTLQLSCSRWLKEDSSFIGKVHKKRLEKATMQNKHTYKDRAMIKNGKLKLENKKSIPKRIPAVL